MCCLARPAVLAVSVIAMLCSCQVPLSDADESHADRKRRSDDTNPLEAVVNQLSQELLQMKAQFAVLNARTSDLEKVVCFTVRLSNVDVTGLGLGQILRFDDVAYNVGNGYDKNTGVFTAPAAGTYVFSLNLQRHGSDEDSIILHLKKGGDLIGQAEAGYSPYEHGAMLITTHLDSGDTVSVQVVHGTTVFGGLPTTFSGFRISS